MAFETARVPTENGAKYLQQLCKHWSHKFSVSFDERQGKVPFSEDAALVLSANGDVLSLRLEAPRDRIPTLEDVVADHLKRFAFREDDLRIEWQPIG